MKRSASDSGTPSRIVKARDCSGSANSPTASSDSRPSASASMRSVRSSTWAMNAGCFARRKKGSTSFRYSVCSGGSISSGSWRTVRRCSSEGIGTRRGASELNVFQSFAALRTSSCRRIIGITSSSDGRPTTPSVRRFSRKGSGISPIVKVSCFSERYDRSGLSTRGINRFPRPASGSPCRPPSCGPLRRGHEVRRYHRPSWPAARGRADVGPPPASI